MARSLSMHSTTLPSSRPDGRDVPAIVITADRSTRVRDAARAEGAHVLNKPVKPASLRALMMQWRVLRVAAE
jgi:CheY-like chemotaxis protein